MIRKARARSYRTTTMPFLLNSYNAVLDLNNKENRKLFKEGSKGLAKSDRFDGKKTNYGDFTKIVEGDIESARVIVSFNNPNTITSSWNNRVTENSSG